MDVSILINNLKKSFKSSRKRQIVLDGLTLSVPEGEIFGFIGPNGAGKSTTIKLLLDFIRPDSGTIHIMGLMVGKQEFRHLIGYLPETPCFYDNLTAEETLEFAARIMKISHSQLKARVQDSLTLVELEEAAKRPVGTYSKGMKQRLGLAMAMIHDPQILILDEPMAGLDPLGRHLAKEFILLQKKNGKTVFFSSHILEDVAGLCDRIAILHRGHLLYEGSVDTFKGDSDLETAFIKALNEWDNGHSTESL